MTSLKKFNSHLAFAVAAICFASPASWAVNDSTQARAIVDAVIRPLMADYDVPGMAVAVTIDGQSLFFNYGVASKEENTPVTGATLFEIGSLSKTFTATLASYAQIIGKLSLSDSSDKYIPQFKGHPIGNVSLLNLGTYTAGGLPLQFPDDIRDEKMIDYFQKWKPDAPIGTQRVYSTPSIGLLGYITGLAMNSDFSNAIETQLLPKLRLTHSYINVPESEMVNYAWGYDKANKPVRVNPGVFDAEAYGIKSTTADLIRFVQANIEPHGLDEPMQRAIRATHIGYFEVGGMVQGLGWEQLGYPITLESMLAGNSESILFDSNLARKLPPPFVPSEQALFDKTGSTGGFGAYAAFIPMKKMGIVILANKNYPIPARIKAAHAILEQLGQ